MAGPTFFGADLIGDSMMLRFSLRHADFVPNFRVYPRSWGLCRSGKTAQELLEEEWMNNSRTGKQKVSVIMIGTNDILHISRDNKQLMIQKKALRITLRKVRDKAVRKFERVLFCTVPEIPQLAEDQEQKTRDRYSNLIASVNAEIMTFSEKKASVTTIDLRSQFDRDCYERFMGRGDNIRPDNIHLNDRGQAVLRDILREELRRFQ